MTKWALASGLLAIAASSALAQAQSQETIHGAPKRRTSTKDRKHLEGLTDLQKMEVKFSWLVEERRKPTPTSAGRGGGPIDSNYRTAQYVHSLASNDPKVLRWLYQSGSVKAAPIRNLIGLALGLSGDMAAKDQMLRVLKTNPNPYMRELAARFLYAWTDADVVAALQWANTTDPFRVSFESTGRKQGVIDGYPVRDSASNSLQIIERDTGHNEWTVQWIATFEEKMKGYDEFVKAHKEDLERISNLINTDRPKKIIR